MSDEVEVYRARGTVAVPVLLGGWIWLQVLADRLGSDPARKEPISTGLFFALGAFFIFRLSAVRVRASGVGLQIRNPLRTTSVPWGDVRELTTGRIGGPMPKVAVVMHNGKRIGISALPVGGAGPGGSTKTAYDHLRAWLQRERDRIAE